MRQGFITKTTVTSREVPDCQAFINEKMCPDSGMVFTDKGYNTEEVDKEIVKKNCASGTIKTNNRKK